jgi:ABC-type multidrug transport system ATPase subunit
LGDEPPPAATNDRTGDVSEIAVEVRGLTKRFGSQLAVDDVSFDLPTGKVVGFLGPNGAGKSTTLRMIIGLTAPSGGTATIFGTPFHDLDDPARTVGSIVASIPRVPARFRQVPSRFHR